MTNPNPVAGAAEPDTKRPVSLLVFSCLLVLGVTAASFALLRTDDRVDESDQVTLQPVAQQGDDGFFGNLDLAAGDESDPGLDEVTRLAATLPPFEGGQAGEASSLSGLEVSGGTEGLYGGIRRAPVCDLDALSEALAGGGSQDGGDGDDGEGGEGGGEGGDGEGGGESQDGDGGDGQGAGDSQDGGGEGSGESQDGGDPRIEAWAGAAGLDSTDGIGDHVASLTAVRLRLDTRITAYGFSGGEAVPRQAVLQAGTAVLVDDTGMPRVRCSGGNPLAAPEPRGDITDSQAMDVSAVAADPDRAWDPLDPDRVVTVVPAPEPVEQFLVVDLDDQQLLERPKGSNGRADLGPGDIQATLRWDSRADLDLQVTDPNGAVISPASPEPPNSSGRLEEDANSQCEGNMVGTETISWPDGDAPPGEYAITVRGHAVGDPYEADCGGNQAEYTLTVEMYGRDDVVHSEAVGDQESRDYTVALEESEV